MTCEIVIMNKHAAVLAADSAITVTQFVNGRKEERYFKGTNKIFQISNYQPVGMMIYAASNLQGVPWEIVAKDFREHLDQAKALLRSEAQSKFFRRRAKQFKSHVSEKNGVQNND